MTTNREQRRDLTVRAYTIPANSYDEETRSIEAVMATEDPVLVFDMKRWEPVYEVLRMEGAVLPESKQIPLLDSHDRSSIQKQLGSTRDIRFEDGKMVGRNVFSSVESDAATKVKEGHVTDNSIGYLPRSFVDIEPGQTRDVMERSYTAPDDRVLRVTTEWVVKENSVLAIGADAMAKHREDHDALDDKPQEKDMPDEKTQDAAPVEEPQAETEQREDAQVEAREAADLEVRKAELRAITPDGYGELFERAVIEGMDVEAYRKALLEEFAKRHEPVGTPDAPEPEKKQERADAVSDDEFLRSF